MRIYERQELFQSQLLDHLLIFMRVGHHLQLLLALISAARASSSTLSAGRSCRRRAHDLLEEVAAALVRVAAAHIRPYRCRACSGQEIATASQLLLLHLLLLVLA